MQNRLKVTVAVSKPHRTDHTNRFLACPLRIGRSRRRSLIQLWRNQALSSARFSCQLHWC